MESDWIYPGSIHNTRSCRPHQSSRAFRREIWNSCLLHSGSTCRNQQKYCMTEKLSTCVHYLHKGETMELEDFTITAFEVPHDGTDNVGYCMNIDGKIFSFLTDLGHHHPHCRRIYTVKQTIWYWKRITMKRC